MTWGLLYLSVCRRYVPAPIDPQQCVVWKRKIELDVGRMVHSYMKPPKKSRRDCLALLSPDVDLATVDGPASHPLFCRQKNKKIKKITQVRPLKTHAADLSRWTGCRIQYQREQLITNLMSSNISVISRCTNEARLNRCQEWLSGGENPAFQETMLWQAFG